MASFGETLKRERELRKITLREVSESTKIGLRYLEALESNRFDQLPGGLFNKGFIRAYSKFIGLDGEAMVNAYLYDLSCQEQPARPRYAGITAEDVPLPIPPPAKKRSWRPPGWAAAGLAASFAVILLAGFALIRYKGSPAPPVEAPIRSRQPQRAEVNMAAAVSPGASREIVPLSPPPPPAKSPAPTSPLREVAPPAESFPKPAIPKESGADRAFRGPDEGLSFSLTTSDTVQVTVTCDGSQRIDRELPAGNTLILSCNHEIRLSTGDAGATEIRINGHECLPLGERGAPIEGLVINRERAGELCPPLKPERP